MVNRALWRVLSRANALSVGFPNLALCFCVCKPAVVSSLFLILLRRQLSSRETDVNDAINPAPHVTIIASILKL